MLFTKVLHQSKVITPIFFITLEENLPTTKELAVWLQVPNILPWS